MTPDEARVREVVGRLSKAQREAVISGRGTSITIGRVWRHEPPLFGSSSWSAGYGELRRPTDLGLAVRAELIRQKGNSHG